MGIKSFFSKLFGPSKDAAEQAPEEKPSCCGGHGRREKAASRGSETAASGECRKEHMRDLEGFVEYVVKALVDYPDEVEVSSSSTGDGKMIKIVCRPTDRGKIIGKKGKTIIALRSLVAGAAGRQQNRVTVEVMDDEDEVKR